MLHDRYPTEDDYFDAVAEAHEKADREAMAAAELLRICGCGIPRKSAKHTSKLSTQPSMSVFARHTKRPCDAGTSQGRRSTRKVENK